MDEENEVNGDNSRWVVLALALLICWLTFRRTLRKVIRRVSQHIHLHYFDAYFLAHFTKMYNERMHPRKEALFFDGLSQMMKDAGRPVRVLEIGVGIGANFAFYPDGTTVTCLEPTVEYYDKLVENAGRFPRIQLGEIHRGFVEDMVMIESGSFDAVVSTLVLCSVCDMDKCLQEIIRVLRPVCVMCIK